MKKVINMMLMLVIVSLFTGCIDKEAYIESVKKLGFQDGRTVESIVIDKIVGIEFEALNKDEISTSGNFIIFNKTGDYVMNSGYLEQQIGKAAMKASVIGIYKTPEIEWSIEGETSKGKVISARSSNGYIRVTVTEDGDYIQLNTDDIQVINNGLYVNDKTIQFNIFINNCLYKEWEKEMKELEDTV